MDPEDWWPRPTQENSHAPLSFAPIPPRPYQVLLPSWLPYPSPPRTLSLLLPAHSLFLPHFHAPLMPCIMFPWSHKQYVSHPRFYDLFSHLPEHYLVSHPLYHCFVIAHSIHPAGRALGSDWSINSFAVISLRISLSRTLKRKFSLKFS